MRFFFEKIKNIRNYSGKFLLIIALSFVVGISFSIASDDTQLTQSISGSLDIGIVDAGGSTVSSPTAVFAAKAFSMTYQTATATLGVSSERMRVTNPSGSDDTWALNVAATSGETSVWTTGSVTYDYNDSTASAGDGADTDSVGGQMTIDPSAGTIAGVGGTSISNVSLGTSDAFVESSVSSIDLMTAATGSQKPGQWDLTGVGLSQTIPAAQASGSYTLNLTLTAS